MSLVVSIRSNADAPHAFITAQRIQGSAEPDSVNTYRYEAVVKGANKYDTIASGDVEHRYGDGSLALVAAICKVADL